MDGEEVQLVVVLARPAICLIPCLPLLVSGGSPVAALVSSLVPPTYLSVVSYRCSHCTRDGFNECVCSLATNTRFASDLSPSPTTMFAARTPPPMWKARHSVRGADARDAQLAYQPRTKPLRIECEPLTCVIGERTSTIGPAVQKARIDGGGPSRSHARPPRSTTPRADAARKCKPSSQPARRHCEHARLELSMLCAHFVWQAPPRHADDATRLRRPSHTCTYTHTRNLSECPQRAAYSSSSPHGPIPHISA